MIINNDSLSVPSSNCVEKKKIYYDILNVGWDTDIE